jgi:hypothetical protein
MWRLSETRKKERKRERNKHTYTRHREKFKPNRPGLRIIYIPTTMDPEYDNEQAVSLLEAAIADHAARTEDGSKAVYMIKVSIAYMLKKDA